MAKLQWYFDYVSPFAYLQWAHQLPRLEQGDIEYKPLLFAGLLKHWGHKGPAEIPGKRRFTYRYTAWHAERLGVAFTMPAAHPFNPLPLLRLSIARDNDPRVVERLFRFVWQEGHIPDDAAAWAGLTGELGATGAELGDPSVKQRLRDNGEEAIAQGVFGVPTLVARGEIFWGLDGFHFLQACLDDPGILDRPALRAVDAVPSGV